MLSFYALFFLPLQPTGLKPYNFNNYIILAIVKFHLNLSAYCIFRRLNLNFKWISNLTWGETSTTWRILERDDASFTASPTPRGKVPSLLVSADPSVTCINVEVISVRERVKKCTREKCENQNNVCALGYAEVLNFTEKNENWSYIITFNNIYIAASSNN